MRSNPAALPPRRHFLARQLRVLALAIFAATLAAPAARAAEFRAPAPSKRPLFAPPPKPPIADDPATPEPARGASPAETPTPAARPLLAAAPPPVAPPQPPAPVAPLPPALAPARPTDSAHAPPEPFTPQKIAPIPGANLVRLPPPTLPAKATPPQPLAPASNSAPPISPTQPPVAATPAQAKPAPPEHSPATPDHATPTSAAAPPAPAAAAIDPSTQSPPSTHPAAPRIVPDDYDFKIRAATDSNNVPFHLEALVKASTNLISKADALRQEQRQKKLGDYQTQLDVARQQRRDKTPARAIAILLELLGGEAPTGFKRPALYELALAHHEDNQLIRAQQIFSQYLKLYDNDPMTPEIYLRQGMIHRQMGTHNLAIGKFYAVMNSALSLKQDKLEYYQTLVLHAQTEIADTYFAQNKFTAAADFYQRLLKLPGTELNRPQIQFKLVRTLASLDRHAEAIANGRMLLNSHPNATEIPETRYQIAMSLKALNKTAEALQEVLSLLQTQQAISNQDPANWAYWQQRTGNEIANYFYREHDDLNALAIYQSLARISAAPGWQLPALYQTGLVYERLRQPAKAVETFDQILQRSRESEVRSQPALTTVVEMARWRKDHINWQEQAELRAAILHTIPINLRTLPAELRAATFDTLAAAQPIIDPIIPITTPTFSPIAAPTPITTPTPQPIPQPATTPPAQPIHQPTTAPVPQPIPKH